MKNRPYIPERGDVVWVAFDPSLGHEQKGRRPAFVLSPRPYNRKAGLFLACPITSKVKGYPFEVRVKLKEIDGAVLSDQVRALDWVERKVKFAEKAKPEVVAEVLEKLAVLLT